MGFAAIQRIPLKVFRFADIINRFMCSCICVCECSAYLIYRHTNTCVCVCWFNDILEIEIEIRSRFISAVSRTIYRKFGLQYIEIDSTRTHCIPICAHTIDAMNVNISECQWVHIDKGCVVWAAFFSLSLFARIHNLDILCKGPLA